MIQGIENFEIENGVLNGFSEAGQALFEAGDTEIVIPKGLVEITDWGAFETIVAASNTVETIGRCAFADDKSTCVVIPGGVRETKDGAFKGSDFTTIVTTPRAEVAVLEAFDGNVHAHKMTD